MFGDINRATLLGNLTRDPELRYTPSGTPVLNFSLVTNRRYKDKTTDQWMDSPEYHDITVWQQAEGLAARLQKGTRVYVEGRISTRSYDKNGEKRYRTDINADNVILLDRLKDGKAKEESEINPDDIPF